MFHQLAESQEPAIPSELLINTIDFVNEHGGWTDEFRYMYMDPNTRIVQFQLFLHGLPVYRDSSLLLKLCKSGGRIGYLVISRPYYTLDSPFPETEIKLLPSGIEIAEMLKKSDTLDFDAVEEITPGYFMKHDSEGLFIMEPSWFYLINGNWIRFSPESLGGELIGLE